MTAREVLASRTHDPGGVVRWTRAAVIALFAALAVLVHHETAAAAIASTPSSAVHVMPGMQGMVMADGAAGQGLGMSAHAHGNAAAQAAEVTSGAPAADGTDGPACSGMAMQHCAPASVDAVKLAPPAESRVTWDADPCNAAVPNPKAAGTVGRAPPDLSVLSQLRI
jgi:hypothetical protein